MYNASCATEMLLCSLRRGTKYAARNMPPNVAPSATRNLARTIGRRIKADIDTVGRGVLQLQSPAWSMRSCCGSDYADRLSAICGVFLRLANEYRKSTLTCVSTTSLAHNHQSGEALNWPVTPIAPAPLSLLVTVMLSDPGESEIFKLLKIPRISLRSSET